LSTGIEGEKERREGRVRSCVTGLDTHLQGGFQRGATILVYGSPGTGETVFCLQFIVRGAVEEREPGIIVTLEETPDQLFWEAASLGLELEGQLGKTIHVIDGASQRLGLEPAGRTLAIRQPQFKLETVMERIAQAQREIGAVRIAIDPVAPLLALGPGETVQERAEAVVARLGGFLWRSGMTSIITARREEYQLGYITQGIIRLEQREMALGEVVAIKRYLTVVKMRGTALPDKVFEFTVERGGIRLRD